MSKKETEGPSVRLNKYLANSGLCNRREADALIKKGEVSVNGEVVTTLGMRVQIGVDRVEHQGKRLSGEQMRYVLINKPMYYVTQGKGGKSIFALMSEACEERVYPVQALGLKDVGLQLFTNDMELAKRLGQKGAKEASLYHVSLSEPAAEVAVTALRKGVKVKGKLFGIKELVATTDSEGLGLGLMPVVDDPKRMQEALAQAGLEVEKVDRVTYAGLTKKNLSRGKWRLLSEREAAFLHMASR